MTDLKKEKWKRELLDRLDSMIMENSRLSANWKYELKSNDQGEEELILTAEQNGNQQAEENDGLCLAMPSVYRQMEENKDTEQAINDILGRLLETMAAAEKDKDLSTNREAVYPVLRSASFPKEKRDGTMLVYRKHTAESTIYYALDLGKSYALIDQRMMEKANIAEEELHQLAIENIKLLDVIPKQDEVQENIFYFFSQKDGYAASRVLHPSLLKGMSKKVKGEMAVAIPHQDVLIVADIRNEVGYQVLSKINMDFCMKGDIPISPLPFIYKQDGELEPIMIINNPGKTGKIRRK